MKQKILIRAQMNDQKSRSKAMKIAVCLPGVISVSIEGKEEDQISVTGDGVDSVTLTSLMRKKMGFAELVTVSAIEEKKDQKKEEKKSTPSSTQLLALPAPTYWTYSGTADQYPYYYSDVQENQAKYSDPCSVM